MHAAEKLFIGNSKRKKKCTILSLRYKKNYHINIVYIESCPESYVYSC